MITIPTKSANYDPENINFFHNLSYFCFGNKLFSSLLSVCALLARLPKRNKRKVVSGSRVTLPVNFACKPRLSFNPLAKVTLAVGSPYLAPSKQGLNRFLRLSLNENLLLLNFRLHFFQSVPCVWEF